MKSNKLLKAFDELQVKSECYMVTDDPVLKAEFSDEIKDIRLEIETYIKTFQKDKMDLETYKEVSDTIKKYKKLYDK